MAKNDSAGTRTIIAAVVGLLLLGIFLINIERFFPAPSATFTAPQRIAVDLPNDRGTHPGAPHTLIMFTDFQCPYCVAAQPIVSELEQQYGKNLNLVIAHFPVGELHPNAVRAAEAAECARREGKFRPYHDLLFQNQDDLSMEALLQYGTVLTLDPAFTRCVLERATADAVAGDVRAGIAAGVKGTPTFFADGYRIEGVQPSTSFGAVFDAEVADG